MENYKQNAKSIVALFSLSYLVFLVFSTPSYDKLLNDQRSFSGPCPLMWNEKHKTISDEEKGYGLIEWHRKGLNDHVQEEHRKRVVDCRKIMNGEEDEVNFAKKFNWCSPSIENLISANPVDVISMDCLQFKNDFGYANIAITKEEAEFPIAFSILTYDDFVQTERLLRAIYKPHNIYCVHIDAKADSVLKNAFIAISKCLPNVIVPQRSINVHWAEFSVLAAELMCMEHTLRSSVAWKYYINLTGREFPLKTNEELVRILQMYNGANDIDGNMYK